MRASLLALVAAGLAVAFGLTGCKGSDDNVSTDDSSELNEGRGSLERDLTPPLDAPTSPRIGMKVDDAFTKAVGTLSPGALPADRSQTSAPVKEGDDCTITNVKDAAAKLVVVQRVTCSTSDTVRVLDANGVVTEEDADLNKDGTVDRFTGTDGSVAQYADTNYDGKIDVVVERVDKLTDFSLTGYGEDFPKADFLYRIREDRNRDGKLDHETMTAKGSLPPKTS